jgi:hypothetical protein
MIENTAAERMFVAINLAVGAEGPGSGVGGTVPDSFLSVGFAGAVDFS